MYSSNSTMATDVLLQPTIHVEILINNGPVSRQTLQEVHNHAEMMLEDEADSSKIRESVSQRMIEDYAKVAVGLRIDSLSNIAHEEIVLAIEVVDYTGPENQHGFYDLCDVRLEVRAYMLNQTEQGRRMMSIGDDEPNQTQEHRLPNVALHDEWNSLVFDDALPARLLRYLVRMMTLLGQPGLNLCTFNWNRICLLHGPPGSGKSTLCRALAQKLSIRLGPTFNDAVLIEINANAMLSKYFGESGKQVSATFNGIVNKAQNSDCLVCVVIDEIETIAGSRARLTSNNECHDGLRVGHHATNQLLTALDRLRHLPNVLVLCTSNIVEAIDPAFLDRVDIKQLVPSPSPTAIYNIFRSCLNELLSNSLIDSGTQRLSSSPAMQTPSSDSWTVVDTPTIPSFSDMQVQVKVRKLGQSASAGTRVWALAQKCQGFSGRTLRRLPILGMAMYTWGGECSLQTALSALEAAIMQELLAARAK